MRRQNSSKQINGTVRNTRYLLTLLLFFALSFVELLIECSKFQDYQVHLPGKSGKWDFFWCPLKCSCKNHLFRYSQIEDLRVFTSTHCKAFNAPHKTARVLFCVFRIRVIGITEHNRLQLALSFCFVGIAGDPFKMKYLLQDNLVTSYSDLPWGRLIP